MIQYSYKSNNTPLAHTTRQFTSSSLRATWLTVSSPALTVPAVDMSRPPTPSAPWRSLRSTNVDDLYRRPALTISAVDTAPSTDVKRSLTLPQTTKVDDLPRCPLCDISASLALRLYIIRQPRRQWKVATWFRPSPVTRARDYQTMESRQSSVTSHCLKSSVWPDTFKHGDIPQHRWLLWIARPHRDNIVTKEACDRKVAATYYWPSLLFTTLFANAMKLGGHTFGVRPKFHIRAAIDCK